MTMQPCIECGVVSTGTRCTEHSKGRERVRDVRRGSASSRGYDAAWGRLSARARRLQPWCSDCGTTSNLTTDHLPSAWERKAAGRPVRLRDVDVVCGDCNSGRGSSRPGSARAAATLGGDPWRVAGRPPPEANFESHSAGRAR